MRKTRISVKIIGGSKTGAYYSKFNMYSLSTYYVPGAVLGAEDRAENKTDIFPAFPKLTF